MNIAIAGNGLAGLILARLLAPLKPHVYGREHKNKCDIRPCGFGISDRALKQLIPLVPGPSIDIFREDNIIFIDGKPVKCRLYSFDKPALLKYLSFRCAICYEEIDTTQYDLVIDATGFSRAYSPPVNGKPGINYQCKIISPQKLYPAFDILKCGYIWTIPLKDNEVHIGCGSTLLPKETINNYVKERVKALKAEVICSCYEPMRVSGPISPLVNNNVVAVGEAAGLVNPLSGGGLGPAVRSAYLLYHNLDRLQQYQRAIEEEFRLFTAARNVLSEWEVTGNISLLSSLILYRALRYECIYPDLTDLWHIRKSIRDA